MISEEQQDQAALYALDLLGADETAAFERELSANAELQTLARELREAAGSLAHSAPQAVQPSPDLKDRILRDIAAESSGATSSNIIAPARSAFATWIPWAIAATLALFCGLLALDRAKLQEHIAQEKAAATSPMLVTLPATEDGSPKAEVVVAWRPDMQRGMIKIRNLPAAARGKDYQLWAVDAEHKDPVSAGILRPSGKGVAEIQFRPSEPAHAVQAFAISLEREGGVPKKEGPILFVGKI